MVFFGHKKISKYRFDGKIISDLRRLKMNESFMADFYVLAEKWFQIEYDKDGEPRAEHCLVYDGESANDFEKDILELRKKYNLGISYQIPLCIWRIYGDPEAYNNSNIKWERPICGSQDLDGDKIFTVFIYPETTIKDIQEAWPEIKKEKEDFYKVKTKRITTRRNIERDLDIAQLRKEGKKAKEIVKFINKYYPNQRISYENVSLLIKRIKQ